MFRAPTVRNVSLLIPCRPYIRVPRRHENSHGLHARVSYASRARTHARLRISRYSNRHAATGGPFVAANDWKYVGIVFGDVLA